MNVGLESLRSLPTFIYENAQRHFKPITYVVAAVALGLFVRQCYKVVCYLHEIKWQVWPFKLWVLPFSLTPEQSALTYGKLLKNSEEFDSITAFPTSKNRMNKVAKTWKVKNEVLHHAKNTRPVIHERVQKFIPKFLAFKKEHGSPIEKQIYENMTVEQFIDRLIKKRPLMFMSVADHFKLRSDQDGMGGFEKIGTALEEETDDLRLKDYLSYDEMRLAAFLQMFVPTHFINKGDRHNKAKNGLPGSFENKGIYVGMVGARFEKDELMECSHMMVTDDQNTAAKGYGLSADPKNPKTIELRMWAELYGSKVGEVFAFPDINEAKEIDPERYVDLGGALLDKVIYKERLRLTIESFLWEANERAKKEGKQGYLHIVGLGLGVWQVASEQKELMLEVYAETIEENHFDHISDLNFSWFGEGLDCGDVKDQEMFDNIKIHFSKRDPAEKLVDEDAGKLLIAQYAWDSNAYPGNEYWVGMLTASGDPAAACCSMIPELQNPQINPFVSGNCVTVTPDLA